MSVKTDSDYHTAPTTHKGHDRASGAVCHTMATGTLALVALVWCVALVALVRRCGAAAPAL